MLKLTILFRFSNLTSLYHQAIQAKNLKYDEQQVAAVLLPHSAYSPAKSQRSALIYPSRLA